MRLGMLRVDSQSIPEFFLGFADAAFAQKQAAEIAVRPREIRIEQQSHVIFLLGFGSIPKLVIDYCQKIVRVRRLPSGGDSLPRQRLRLAESAFLDEFRDALENRFF